MIYEKYENNRVIQSYFNNETDFNYKADMIINISKISLKTIVKEATESFSNLDKNLVYYKSNDYNYSIIILGHSGLGYGTYFNRLDEVNINDEIKLYVDDMCITYQVRDKFIINEERVDILDSKENNTLFLITCKKNDNTKRLVIKSAIKSKKKLKK